MFQRLYELSTILPQSLATWEKLNEGMPPEYNRGFALCFDEQGKWVGVRTVHKTGKDVIYRAGSSSGTDLTPCYKLSPTTLKRLLKSVENLTENFTGTESDWLKTSIESYQQNQSMITEELENAQKSAGLNSKDVRGFVFWAKWLNDGQIDPVYTWDIAKQYLEQRFFEPLVKGGERKSGICMITGEKHPEVYGNFSDIACYNLDKPGSIAGGFSEKLAHRNFPVSKEAAVEIAYAFTYATNYLKGSMTGETYLILPYAVNSDVREQLHEHLSKYPERFKLGKVKDLVSEEWELVNEFSNDQIAFFLIFYKEKQASWRIQAEIQELLPSRLQQLKKAREKIEKASDLANLAKEDEAKGLAISAWTFKNFTSKPVASDKEIKNTLRNWLVALFEGKAVDYHHFLRHLVDKLVSTGKKNPEYLLHTTREAYGLYRYALLTGLITLRKTTMELPEFTSIYGRYIHDHSDFFTKPEIVTAFLSGCYASTMANVQYQKRKATPFTKKFIGRLLSKEMLKRLYQEAHNKLMQYDSLGIVAKGLDPDLTQSWIACGQNWNISNEETTFAFTIGYSLQYRISQLYKEPATNTTEE